MKYSEAGVNIEAGNEAVRRIRELARASFTPGVLTDIGSFGGLFRPDLSGMAEPVLVASADGVGTKLKVAILAGVHNTVGADLVAHCINDILVQGATPLFFLDYLATGRLDPSVVEAVVGGMARACTEYGCALLGGETAEMPGFYADGEYDLAGFIVGLVDRKQIIDGSAVEPGDRLIGLASIGLHTNGYSLARAILFERDRLSVDSRVPGVDATIGETLLAPHRCYLPLLRDLLPSGILKGMAPITGGGLTDNLPRVLPHGTAAIVRRGTWPVLPIFELLQARGAVPDEEMFRTFNMGIGMALIVAPRNVGRLVEALRQRGERAYEIGEIIKGDRGVRYDPPSRMAHKST